MSAPAKSKARVRPQRGAASVEAVIVVPFMILIFASIFHIALTFNAKHEVLMHARTQAWESSANACEGAPTTKNRDQPGKERLSGIKSEAASGDKTNNAVMNLLQEPMDLIFGESVATTASKEVKPNVLGMKSTTVSGQYHLVCNLKPKTLGDVAVDLWKAIF